MPFIKYGKHTIEVRFERHGEETVFYDGEVVSSKMTTFGGTHKFSVTEDGENVNYEVKVKPKGGALGVLTGFGLATAPTVEVRRNGKKIYPQ